MSEQPLISVVIPCLNRAQFLVPTIESVLQQDYPNIECIVVDGGSTDDTVEILKGYGDRIRWISEPDEGHADAINKGWYMSKGEILAWLNADDMWVVPHAASQAVAYLQAHPEVDVVYGDCEAIDIEGNFLAMSYRREWDLEHAVEYCDYCIPQPTSFIHRRVLEKVGWLDTSFISKKDHELWLRIGLVGTIRYIPVLLARERIGPGYLAQRGDITAAACVALTKKFFTLPNVSESLRAKKQRALSNSYLEGMKWAFECGRYWQVIFSHALRAALVDPTNARNAFDRLKYYLAFSASESWKLRWALMGLESLSLPGRALRKVKR
jgi:glycosyltransferase involved in cell wall biosynthesis